MPTSGVDLCSGMGGWRSEARRVDARGPEAEAAVGLLGRGS